MKAWMVGGDFVDGVWLVHAETPGKAKQAARMYMDLGDFGAEFTELRATRCNQLDDKPLTIENVEHVLAFPDAVDEDGDAYTGEYCTRENYVNQCHCEICKIAQIQL